MKDTYTKEQRKRYNRLYRYHGKNKKSDLMGPPKPLMCLCTRDWGMWKIGSEYICHACKATEGVNWHVETRSQPQPELAVVSPESWLTRTARWIHDETVGYAGAFVEEQKLRIKSWIEDDGKEIVVHGHGEYHLALNHT